MIQTDWIVEAEEHDDTHQGVPGELHDNVGDDEGFPGICLGRAFAGFVKSSLSA